MSVLIELVGAIALLLWGLRMVRTGMMRAYGSHLKLLARQNEGRLIPMLGSGFLFAILIQSSTATAIIVASFAGQNILSISSALIVILGADIGTAVAVILASQKITVLSPILLAIGIFGFLSTEKNKLRNLFRAIAGLGLILLALSMVNYIGTGLANLQEFNTVMQVFVSQPFLMLLFGVVLTYLAHSSLAIVLLVVGFVQSGLLLTDAGLFLVLGANVGSGLLPVVANWKAKRNAKIPVKANFLIRVLGVTAVFPFVGPLLAVLGDSLPAYSTPAFFHLFLNIGVAIIGLVLLPLIIKLVTNLESEDSESAQAIEPKNLDKTAFSSPSKALACAKREALNMANITQIMLRNTLPVLKEGNDELRQEIAVMEDDVERLFNAIKIYIARIMREELTEEEAQRAMDLLSFTANMEHMGDIIEGSLMELAVKKENLGAQFSQQGFTEITALHEAVTSTFELAINTFISEDSDLARMLFDAKASIRELESKSVTTHLERIGTGISQSIETSSLHLDIIRDLKRINSHLTSIAYPVLKASGKVPKTKWKKNRTIKGTEA
ncbi:Na/Pi cotransporter family protein [Alphaproteobacteria bacterium]|nr:Na/Pi cotransporter family protein [Alphaproteobacteria bacterium]